MRIVFSKTKEEKRLEKRVDELKVYLRESKGEVELKKALIEEQTILSTSKDITIRGLRQERDRLFEDCEMAHQEVDGSRERIDELVDELVSNNITINTLTKNSEELKEEVNRLNKMTQKQADKITEYESYLIKMAQKKKDEEELNKLKDAFRQE